MASRRRYPCVPRPAYTLLRYTVRVGVPSTLVTVDDRYFVIAAGASYYPCVRIAGVTFVRSFPHFSEYQSSVKRLLSLFLTYYRATSE